MEKEILIRNGALTKLKFTSFGQTTTTHRNHWIWQVSPPFSLNFYSKFDKCKSNWHILPFKDKGSLKKHQTQRGKRHFNTEWCEDVKSKKSKKGLEPKKDDEESDEKKKVAAPIKPTKTVAKKPPASNFTFVLLLKIDISLVSVSIYELVCNNVKIQISWMLKLFFIHRRSQSCWTNTQWFRSW